MKFISVIAAFFLFASHAKATLPVIDYVAIGHAIASYITQLQQFVKETQQTIDQDTIVLKEIQQVENEIIQLERMGDPKAYGANLPGVGVITGMAQIYQQGKQDAEDWASFANPQSVKLTAEQIMGLYSNSLNGLTTNTGFHVPPAQGLIQFSLSDYNTAQGASDSITKLIATKTSLTQARDTAIAQMKAASSDAEVQKDNALIGSLNGAIAGVDGQIQQAAVLANLQAQKNQAADKIYRAGVTVQSASSFSAEVAAAMDSLAGVAPNDLTVPKWQP